jgi:hypothetical protein
MEGREDENERKRNSWPQWFRPVITCILSTQEVENWRMEVQSRGRTPALTQSSNSSTAKKKKKKPHQKAV